MDELSERESRYYTLARRVIFAVAPLLAGYITYINMLPQFDEPADLVFSRAPGAPPHSIVVHDVQYPTRGNLNPLARGESGYEMLLRAEPGQMEPGASVYSQECVLCHGANLTGQGMFAYAFRPVPSNLENFFEVLYTEDAYIFWRVAKGGPNQEPIGAPWQSAMPPMEEHLTAGEMWRVISFAYWFTQKTPPIYDQYSGVGPSKVIEKKMNI